MSWSDSEAPPLRFGSPRKRDIHGAHRVVHVAASRPIIIAETADSRTNFESYQRTQLAYIKSRLVLNAALHDAKVAQLPVIREQSDPVAWLEKQVVADFSAGPELLRIQLTGDAPDQQLAIVAAIRDAYLREVRAKENSVRDSRYKKLNEIWAESDNRLNGRKGASSVECPRSLDRLRTRS